MLKNQTYSVAVSRLTNASRQILTQQKRTFAATNKYYHHRVLLSQRFQQNKAESRQQVLSRKFSSGKRASEIPNEQRTDIVLTPGQKVAAGSRLAMYLGFFSLGLTGVFFTVRELMPTKMSPNTIQSNAHSLIADNHDVKYRYGSPVKTYGKDMGRNEGRRNFIEHSKYTDKEDGSERVRVKFSLEGPQGKKAFVFAEVSSDMPRGEFVYVLVQDKSNGMVITVVDNRSMLAAKRMAGGNKGSEAAFASLLGGGRSN